MGETTKRMICPITGKRLPMVIWGAKNIDQPCQAEKRPAPMGVPQPEMMQVQMNRGMTEADGYESSLLERTSTIIGGQKSHGERQKQQFIHRGVACTSVSCPASLIAIPLGGKPVENSDAATCLSSGTWKTNDALGVCICLPSPMLLCCGVHLVISERQHDFC